MKGLDYRHYAIRIKEALMEEDVEKYRYVSVKAIKSHLKHISWCLTKIVTTHNDHFESAYFTLERSYKKFFNTNYQIPLYNKKVAEELRLEEIEKNTPKPKSRIPKPKDYSLNRADRFYP